MTHASHDHPVTQLDEPTARIASWTGFTSSIAISAGSGALGALAVGALAIGALRVGKLRIGDARIDRLEIGELVVLGGSPTPRT